MKRAQKTFSTDISSLEWAYDLSKIFSVISCDLNRVKYTDRWGHKKFKWRVTVCYE